MLGAPWTFRASQLSLRSEQNSPLRLRELLVQGPAELEVTAREALLWFPSSSCSPSHQRREGAGRAREEQLQCSPSSPQEQEGPSSCGGPVRKGEKGQRRLSHPHPPGGLSGASPPPHSPCT